MKPRVTNDRTYAVEAVLRALDVLETFDGQHELSLQEVSRRTGLNKSRCFRLLHTLTSRKYLERTADGQAYRLGLRLIPHAAATRRDVREIAHGYLLRLRDQFNETVNLGLIHTGEILYIDLAESQRPFRMAAMIGSRMPVESTAMGKAMLARMSKDAVREAMAGRAVSRGLAAEIDRARERGYAIDNEQNERGVACIGAAILDSEELPVAAISMSGPVHRILGREREIAKAVRAACGEISARHGVGQGMQSRSRLNGGAK